MKTNDLITGRYYLFRDKDTTIFAFKITGIPVQYRNFKLFYLPYETLIKIINYNEIHKSIIITKNDKIIVSNKDEFEEITEKKFCKLITIAETNFNLLIDVVNDESC